MKKIQVKRPRTPEEEVTERAIQVFGSENVAAAWLTSPSYGLGQKTPTSVLQTPGGREKVLTLLSRIERGVYT